MYITILGNLYSFPNGRAATNYIRLFGRGLVEAGDQVHVMIPEYTESRNVPLNTLRSGRVDGISFEYMTSSPIPPQNPWKRKGDRLMAKIQTPWSLISKRRHGQLDCLIFYGHDYALMERTRTLCKLIRTPFVTFMVEWPEAFITTGVKDRRNYQKLCSRVFQDADAAVVISSYLESRARSISVDRRKPLPVLRIPILVDTVIWENVQPSQLSTPYVLYCADLDGYLQDGLFVIRAFARLNIPGLKLLIVGRASLDTQEILWSEAREANCAGRLIIRTDFVSTEELRSLYTGAQALLAPLNQDDRSLARFPSKLADYLMSMQPVVSCSVGEVGEYLKDGETAFLSPPSDLVGFTEKLKEAITSSRSREIGLNGRSLASKCFDFREQGKRLHNFLVSAQLSS